MAEAKGHGLVGQIPNAGAAVIKATNQVSQPAKDKVVTGKDLRSGSK